MCEFFCQPSDNTHTDLKKKKLKLLSNDVILPHPEEWKYILLVHDISWLLLSHIYFFSI